MQVGRSRLRMLGGHGGPSVMNIDWHDATLYVLTSLCVLLRLLYVDISITANEYIRIPKDIAPNPRATSGDKWIPVFVII